MATLTGQTIASSYEQLLSLPNGGLNGATLVAITDGDSDTACALSVATTSISIGATHKLYLDAGGNTYIHEAAADRLDFVVGGDTDGLVLLEAGGLTSVGLGIAAPLAQLHIVGSDTTDQVIIENTDDVADSAPDLILYRNSSSPAAADALGNITFRGQDSAGNTQNYGSISCIIDHPTSGDEQGTLNFLTAGPSSGSNSVKMTILNDGNVGVGTTTPISALEVEDGVTTGGAILTHGTKETTVVVNDVLGRINFYAPLEGSGTDAIAVAASIAAVAQDTFDSSTNSTALAFQTGKSEVATTKMVIDEDGKVGINLSTPSAKLHMHNSDADIGTMFKIQATNATMDAGSVFMDLDCTADADISNLYFAIFQDSDGHIGSIRCSSASAVAFNTSSDYRLKENLSSITDALTRINQLNPVKFNFKKDSAKIVYDGLIAHETQAVLPYAVAGDKDAMTKKVTDGVEKDVIDPQMIDYGKLTPILIAAVQELSASNDALKARIEVLEG